MQLSLTTDYAVRIILYLLEKGVVVKSQELSEKLCIPKTYVLKVTKKMEKSGLVTLYTGVNGGVAIARRAEEITLWDVVYSTEKTVKINKCLEEDGECSRQEAANCPVREVYCVLQEAVKNRLSAIKFDDLLKSRKQKLEL
ncbi:MAG: Rrf2 family transcriptional regulator [Clostridiales bacterium]|nr:Rrf2 family transcriptional regulator [Proteus hauseri]MBS6521265.1 Rrf2 family transcriptional regulator [Clostridiales bacterium]